MICSKCKERRQIIEKAKAEGKSWLEIAKLVAEHVLPVPALLVNPLDKKD